MDAFLNFTKWQATVLLRVCGFVVCITNMTDIWYRLKTDQYVLGFILYGTLQFFWHVEIRIFISEMIIISLGIWYKTKYCNDSSVTDWLTWRGLYHAWKKRNYTRYSRNLNRSLYRLEDNIKMDMVVWFGFMCLRIGTIDGPFEEGN